jgi:hypothetical protein
MYICNSCGELFEECEIVEEHHPYGEGSAVEVWVVCPHCGDNDFDKAEKCSRCGEYVAETYDGLCDICYDDMNGCD